MSVGRSSVPRARRRPTSCARAAARRPADSPRAASGSLDAVASGADATSGTATHPVGRRVDPDAQTRRRPAGVVRASEASSRSRAGRGVPSGRRQERPRNALRDSPYSIGQPKCVQLVEAVQQLPVVLAGLGEPEAGVQRSAGRAGSRRPGRLRSALRARRPPRRPHRRSAARSACRRSAPASACTRTARPASRHRRAASPAPPDRRTRR